MAKKKANFLKDIQVAEVSIVPKAANNRSFLLFKAEDGEGNTALLDEGKETPNSSTDNPDNGNSPTALDDAIAALAEAVRNNKQHPEEVPMKLEDVLKAASESKLDNETAIKEAVTKSELPEDKAEVVSAILRIAKAAELPSDLLGVIAQLGGFKLPEAKPTEKPDGDTEAQLSKEAAKLSPEARAELEKQQKEIADLKKQAESAVAALKKAEDEREVEKAISKAATDFPNLPVPASELGPIMKSVNEKLDTKLVEKLVQALKAGNDAIARSKDFEEVGKAYTDSPNDLSTKVQELMKADPKLSRAQAIAKAVDENQNFYADYREVHGG